MPLHTEIMKMHGNISCKINDKNTTLDYSDITEELCQHCAECCKICLPINLDERYLEFLITLGYSVIKDTNNPSVGVIEMGYCKHIIREGNKFKCTIYENRPKFCKDYNCVAWAKYSNTEKDSPILKHALKTYNQLKQDIEM